MSFFTDDSVNECAHRAVTGGGYGNGVFNGHNDSPPGAESEHRTAVAENGSFAFAHCSCGWSGPGRRARGRARQDALAHSAD